jgi:hypothetical protein
VICHVYPAASNALDVADQSLGSFVDGAHPSIVSLWRPLTSRHMMVEADERPLTSRHMMVEADERERRRPAADSKAATVAMACEADS